MNDKPMYREHVAPVYRDDVSTPSSGTNVGHVLLWVFGFVVGLIVVTCGIGYFLQPSKHVNSKSDYLLQNQPKMTAKFMSLSMNQVNRQIKVVHNDGQVVIQYVKFQVPKGQPTHILNDANLLNAYAKSEFLHQASIQPAVSQAQVMTSVNLSNPKLVVYTSMPLAEHAANNIPTNVYLLAEVLNLSHRKQQLITMQLANLNQVNNLRANPKVYDAYQQLTTPLTNQFKAAIDSQTMANTGVKGIPDTDTQRALDIANYVVAMQGLQYGQPSISAKWLANYLQLDGVYFDTNMVNYAYSHISKQALYVRQQLHDKYLGQLKDDKVLLQQQHKQRQQRKVKLAKQRAVKLQFQHDVQSIHDNATGTQNMFNAFLKTHTHQQFQKMLNSDIENIRDLAYMYLAGYIKGDVHTSISTRKQMGMDALKQYPFGAQRLKSFARQPMLQTLLQGDVGDPKNFITHFPGTTLNQQIGE